MTAKININIFLIILLTFGCAKKAELDRDFVAENLSRIDSIELRGILGKALQVKLIDSILMINEFRNDMLLSFWNKNNGKLIKKEGRVGRGPYEFNPPIYLNCGDQGKNIQIIDRRKNTVSNFILNNDLSIKFTKKYGPFSSSCQVLTNVEDLIIGQGLFKDGRFIMYDLDNNKVGVDGEFPNIKIKLNGKGVENIDNNVKAMIFQGSIISKPREKMFAFIHSKVPIIEVFEVLENREIKKVNEFRIEADINLKEFSSGRVVSAKLSDTSPRGFIDAHVTNEYIYTLYSGRSRREFPNNYYLGNSILVFDWECNLIKRYLLDKEIKCFTMTKKLDKIYALPETVDSIVYIYSL